MKYITDKDAWEGQADCVSCTLRDSVLFAGLEEKDFDQIHQPIEIYNLKPGESLYRAGERADVMFTVRTGSLKLVQYLPDGGQRIVRLIRATDVTGLEALLGQPYQHDAVVLEACQVCTLPVSVVQALARTNPKLHQELLTRWQRALGEADAWLTELSTGSARQRLARLLLRVVAQRTPPECILFSREDIGAMLGVTTETASRTVAEFKRQGLVKEIAGNRHLLDTAGLQRIADE